MTSTFEYNHVTPVYPCLKATRDDDGATTIVLLSSRGIGVVVASESKLPYLAVGRYSASWADDNPAAFKPFNGTVTLKG